MACLRDSWRTSLPASRPHRNPSRVLRPESVSDSVGSISAWHGAREPLHSGLAAQGLGWTGGQAPQPHSGAPEAQGLTARAGPKRSSIGRNETRSDIVCRMKSRILHVNAATHDPATHDRPRGHEALGHTLNNSLRARWLGLNETNGHSCGSNW